MLPGVGVRHEFTTTAGDQVSVLTHRGGRREVGVASGPDPDVSSTVLRLSAEDTRTLAEILGVSQISEAVTAVQQQVEGLAIEWLTVRPESGLAGSTIAEGELRTRTGASIVAILRGDTTIAAPTPEVALLAGDVAVAVGTPGGLSQLSALLEP